MLLYEALYPRGDAVFLLSLVKLVSFLVALEQITLERQSSSVNYA